MTVIAAATPVATVVSVPNAFGPTFPIASRALAALW